MKNKIIPLASLFLYALCANAYDVTSNTSTSVIGSDTTVAFKGDYTVDVDTDYTVNSFGGGNINATFNIVDGGSLTIGVQKPTSAFEKDLEGSITFSGSDDTMLYWISSGWGAQMRGKMDNKSPLLTTIFDTNFVYNQNTGDAGGNYYFAVNSSNYQFNKNVNFIAQPASNIGLLVGDAGTGPNVVMGKADATTNYTADISGSLRVFADSSITINKNYTANFGGGNWSKALQFDGTATVYGTLNSTGTDASSVAGTLNVLNGGVVKAASALTVGATGVVNVGEGSSLTVASVANSGKINMQGGTLKTTAASDHSAVIGSITFEKASTVEVADIRWNNAHTVNYGTLVFNGASIDFDNSLTVDAGNTVNFDTTLVEITGGGKAPVVLHGNMISNKNVALKIWDNNLFTATATSNIGTAEKAFNRIEIYGNAVVTLGGTSNIKSIGTPTYPAARDLMCVINVTSQNNKVESLGLVTATLNVEDGGKIVVGSITTKKDAVTPSTWNGQESTVRGSIVNIKKGGVLEITNKAMIETDDFTVAGSLILGALSGGSSITGKITVDGGKIALGSDVNFAGGLVLVDGTTMTVDLGGNKMTVSSLTGENIGIDFLSTSDIIDGFIVENITEDAIKAIKITMNGLDAIIDYKEYGTTGYEVSIQIPEPAEWAMIFGAIALGFVAYRRRK